MFFSAMYFSQNCGVLYYLPCGVAWCHCESSSNETEQESKYLSAVSKTVDKEVDAAVNAQKKMANEENLRAHGNML